MLEPVLPMEGTHHIAPKLTGEGTKAKGDNVTSSRTHRGQSGLSPVCP